MPIPYDFTGLSIGHLVVDHLADTRRGKSREWVCKCRCGGEIKLTPEQIKKGNIISCGCTARGNKTDNRSYAIYYIHRGDVVIGIISSGDYFLIDKEDFPIVRKYKWSANKKRRGVLQTKRKGKVLYLHRLVLGESVDGKEVDHINHITEDCTKSNLRICNRLQNMSNVKGKGYYKRGNRWVAYIRSNYKQIYIGCFATEEEAKAARLFAEIKLRGEFAYRRDLCS